MRVCICVSAYVRAYTHVCTCACMYMFSTSGAYAWSKRYEPPCMEWATFGTFGRVLTSLHGNLDPMPLLPNIGVELHGRQHAYFKRFAFHELRVEVTNNKWRFPLSICTAPADGCRLNILDPSADEHQNLYLSDPKLGVHRRHIGYPLK